ncbi:hypothetical protein ABZZ20_36830, partial [Streptomyces sp. NPDC006430]|uniref:hypothetical protein n=1 Tax=Streptomyces sp. NPDC006430 TaxID=3154299 RepID=UPI00339DFAF8
PASVGRFRAEYEALRLELLRLRELGESFDAKEWVRARVAEREAVESFMAGFSVGELEALNVEEWPSADAATTPELVQKICDVLGTDEVVARVIGVKRKAAYCYRKGSRGPDAEISGRIRGEYEALRLELLRLRQPGESFDAEAWVLQRSAARRIGTGPDAASAVDYRLRRPGQPLSLPGGSVRLAEAAGDPQAVDVRLEEESTLGQGGTGLDELLDSPAVLDARVRRDHVEGLPWSTSAAVTWALAPGTEVSLGDALGREDRAIVLRGHPELFPAEVREILDRMIGGEEGGSLPA